MGRRLALILVIMACLFAITAATFAGGWGGIRVTGGSLRVEGQGYGLGQVDQARITATLSGFIVCTNNGGNIAPGQNRYTTTVSQNQAVTVRNGKFNFNFFFSDADLGLATTDWQAAGCPNANWTVDYLHDRLTFTLNEIEGGVVIARTAATYSCVMNPPALNGTYVCS